MANAAERTEIAPRALAHASFKPSGQIGASIYDLHIILGLVHPLPPSPSAYLYQVTTRG